MSIRRPFTPTGGSEKNAVLSNRYHNIPLYASIGEIIDNSIEWNANKIWIYCEWNKKQSTNQIDQPLTLAFIEIC